MRKAMNRGAALLLALCLTLTLLPGLSLPAEAAGTRPAIGVGDYIELGSCDGARIL